MGAVVLASATAWIACVSLSAIILFKFPNIDW